MNFYSVRFLLVPLVNISATYVWDCRKKGNNSNKSRIFHSILNPKKSHKTLMKKADLGLILFILSPIHTTIVARDGGPYSIMYKTDRALYRLFCTGITPCESLCTRSKTSQLRPLYMSVISGWYRVKARTLISSTHFTDSHFHFQ